jgi:hypothetical protein
MSNGTKHQGEPVYQLRNPVVGNVWRDADKQAYDSAENLAEYERRVLYTHVDPGEIDALRYDCQVANSVVNAQAEELKKLRAPLAERDALLRDTKAMLSSELSYELFQKMAAHIKRIEVALSASAEPSVPKCETCSGFGAVGNILNAEPCPDCSYGAPVEIDDRTEFEREDRYLTIKKSRLDTDKLEVLECFLDMHGYRSALVSGLVVETDWPEYEPTWARIAARAAMERKS